MSREKLDLEKLSSGLKLPFDIVTKAGVTMLRRDTIITQDFINNVEQGAHKSLYMEIPANFSGDLDDDLLSLIPNRKSPTANTPALNDKFDSLENKEAVNEKRKKVEQEVKHLQEQMHNNLLDAKFVSKFAKPGIGDELEKRIDSGKVNSRPVGSSLRATLRNKSPVDRDLAYKVFKETSYHDIVFTAKKTFISVVTGESHSAEGLLKIVENLLGIYEEDQEIMVNLASFFAREEDYLFNHSVNVCLLSMHIATSMGYSRNQVHEIGMGALLSDIGMLLIHPNLRLRKKELTSKEVEYFRMHPIFSSNVIDRLRRIPLSSSIIAYQAHERINGSGYPKKRRGRVIHTFSKIVSVADIYLAMTHNRVYRPALRPFTAMKTLLSMSKTGLLDGKVVKPFLECMGLFPLGSLVRLSDGSVAKVVQINPNKVDCPIISVLTSTTGQKLPRESLPLINLNEHSELKISDSLSGDEFETGKMTGF